MCYMTNLTSNMVFLQRHWIEYYRILSVVNCRVAINFTFNDSCFKKSGELCGPWASGSYLLFMQS